MMLSLHLGGKPWSKQRLMNSFASLKLLSRFSATQVVNTGKWKFDLTIGGMRPTWLHFLSVLHVFIYSGLFTKAALIAFIKSQNDQTIPCDRFMDPLYALVLAESLSCKSREDALSRLNKLLWANEDVEIEVLKELGAILIVRLSRELEFPAAQVSSIIRNSGDVHGILIANLARGLAMEVSEPGELKCFSLSSRLSKRLANIASLTERSSSSAFDLPELPLPGVSRWQDGRYTADEEFYKAS